VVGKQFVAAGYHEPLEGKMENYKENLKYSLDYIEGRIKFVDSKASFLIAVQTGIFAALSFIFDKFFFNKAALGCQPYVFISGIGFVSAIIICLLFQTIRPTKSFFTQNIFSKKERKFGMLWPDMRNKPDRSSFNENINDYSENDFLEELKNSLYVAQDLVYGKYKYYRYAVLISKYQIFAIGFIFYYLTMIIHK